MPGSLWYTPAAGRAEWMFVSAATFVAAIDMDVADSARRVAAALWACAAEPAPSIEELIGSIPVDAADGIGSFAVVSFAAAAAVSAFDPAAGGAPGERAVTAVVRGDAVVDVFSVGGSRRFAAGPVRPWLLANFRNVTAVGLGGGQRPLSSTVVPDAAALPLTTGVVLGSSLLYSAKPLAFAFAEPGDAERGDAEPSAAAGATVVAAAAGAVGAVSALEAEDTVLLHGARNRPETAEPTSPLPPPHRFRLTGSAPRSLAEPAVFGRRPLAARMSGAAQLITVASADAVVSAAHLRIEQQGTSVVVTDLHSRNGTLMRPPSGPTRRLHPGEAVVVLAGTALDIGDGNIIEIMPPESGDPSGELTGPVREEHA